MYTSYSKDGIDTTEVKKEIISTRESLQEISNRIEHSKKENQTIGQEQYDNTFQEKTLETSLPTRQNRFSRFFSQLSARFLKRNQNYNKSKDSELYNSNNNISQKNSQPKEKKSWKLETAEKERIQKETAQIAEKYMGQEEQQKQAPIQELQQDDYIQY